MAISLYPHQREALPKLKTGKILYGGYGSGKSRTAIAWYYLENGGSETSFEEGCSLQPMDDPPKDLYIITTAKKRDKLEWESELAPFLITKNEEIAIYKHKVVVDSWNNIKKYVGVTGAYFIFDEQRVVGSGVWVKSFLKIAQSNEWILLSATPGDAWPDYIPVFIANGYYRNRTEFIREHVVYKPYVSYPVIDRYMNIGRLLRLRRNILIPMNFERKTKAHDKVVDCEWDKIEYKKVLKERWDTWKNKPIESASGLCYCLRRVVNGDESRFQKLGEVLSEHPRCIIFYNYDYGLEALKEYLEKGSGVDEVAEWNGHKHQDVPVTYSEELGRDKSWVYLVQYNAGAEGWNCTTTDTIIFWSQTYSYKQLQQAKGRIDRLNTPYTDLYYYHFKSKASIDIAISRALKDKKKFNEFSFVNDK